MEARSEIYMKFHVNYCFASSRHDCLRHPTSLVDILWHKRMMWDFFIISFRLNSRLATLLPDFATFLRKNAKY